MPTVAKEIRPRLQARAINFCWPLSRAPNPRIDTPSKPWLGSAQHLEHCHFLPGHVWHITRRCHQKKFLVKFARDRRGYLRWLFEDAERNGL
jgi:hypothetical protein